MREISHDRGVVHEDVDAAERVDRGAGHRLRGRQVAHVDRDPDDVEAVTLQGTGGLAGGPLVDVGQHHRCTRFAERAPVRGADAAGAAGDDRHLPAQVEEL